ncbi:MAG: translocation/assembly module TamB domain-containing protein [Bacteroidales bacterium]|nr:translocation/assembly module TamB domain-containing protein [Bacteroidales bacterium]
MGKAAKHTRRLFRTIIGVVLFAAILLFVTGLVFMIPSVQTKAARKAAAILSEELQTKIAIEKLRLYWNLDFSVEGLCIEDRHQQPMFAASSLKGSLPHHNRSQRTWRFNSMEVEDLLVYNAKYKDEPENNMKFLFAFFASDKEKKPVKLLFEDVKLKNGTYIWYHEQRCKEDVEGVWNYDHIRLQQIDADISSITVADGECLLEISHLDCREHSGFTISDLQTLLTVSSKKLYLENTTFDAIGGSHIDMDFRFDFDSWKQYSDFEDSVLFRCQLRPSLLHTTDLTYFSPALHGIEPVAVRLQGKVDNSLSHLEIKQFACHLNDSTHLRGNLYTEGIRNARTARWDAQIDGLSVALQQIEGFHLPGGKTVSLPDELRHWIVREGVADFHGRFDDFTADVEATGNMGTLRASGIYRNNEEANHFHARFQTQGFPLQPLLHSPMLGALTSQGEISGTASTVEDFRVDIHSIAINDRPVHKVKITGDMEDDRIGFQLTAADSELQTDMKGFVELGEENIFYAVGDIQRLNLSAFHLMDADSEAVVSLHARAELTGRPDNGLSGMVGVSRASMTVDGRTERIPGFQLHTNPTSDGEQDILLQSVPLQASLNGKVRLADIYPCIMQLLQQHVPHIASSPLSPLPDSTAFALSLKMTREIPLLEMLLPNIHIGAGCTANARYSALTGDWSMQARLPSLGLWQTTMSDCRLESDRYTDTLRLTAECEKFVWSSSDSMSQLQNIKMQTDLFRDTALFRLHNKPESGWEQPFLDLGGFLRFEKAGQSILQLQRGLICLHENQFVLDTGNKIIIGRDNLQIRHFQLQSDQQLIAVEGEHSKNGKSRIQGHIRSLRLSELEPLISPYGIALDGTANGEIQLGSQADKLQLYTILNIDSLVFNEVTYGHLDSKAQWSAQEDMIRLQAKLFPLQDSAPTIHLHGNYRPDGRQIDLNGEIRTFNLHAIAPYLTSFATDVEGTASGKLHLSGPLQRTSLTGNLFLEDALMRIGYINTLYHIKNQNIKIQDSAFLLQDLQCTDIQGHPAYLNGIVSHRQLKRWGVRLDIKTDNTLVLNTDYRDNDLFYGKAYGTGTVRLRLLPQGDFYISGDMRTEKQTYISVMLNKGASIEKHQSYIVFEKPYSLSKESDTLESGSSHTAKTHLRFNLNVTPDATLKVVLDPSIGGTIIGNGTGSIRMELQPDRPFEMYGGYTLSEGNIDLALGNVFTRTLSIENGSTINWNGQPDKGEMNVRAIYTTKTSITSLLGESSVTSSYRSVPVSTGLRLKGELLNPEFDFDIRLDNVDESIRSMVYNTLDTTDKENMFRQAFSLMLLGRFDVQNPDGENNVNYGIGYSLSELFSHYLQKTVSTLTDNVNVGFMYRPGDGVTNGDEYNIQLSTNLMENRLVIRGNLDIYGDNNSQNERQAVAGNVVGDIIFEYKITSDGSLRIKAFNMANYYDVLSAAYSDVPYYQGIGFSFTKDFDNLKGLFSRNRK